MQMRRVSLGKTAKENSQDMEGGLPDSREGWPRSPLETKTSRRRIKFSALSATSPVELWVQVNMSLFFLPSYCQKLFGNIEICFSLHCSLGRKNWISPVFPHRMFCSCSKAVFPGLFYWMNWEFWIELKNKWCIMHYADYALWITL